MGDQADMVLEGLTCQGCGEYLGDDKGEGCGFPTWCPGCQQGHPEREPGYMEGGLEIDDETPTNDRVPCPRCGRNNFKTVKAMEQHLKDKHGEPCDECGQGKFKSDKALNDHKRNKHGKATTE